MQKSTKKSKSGKSSPRSARPSPADYQLVVKWSQVDEAYVVTIPAWQNVRTHGVTLEAAAKNAQAVLELLITSAIENGERIPTQLTRR